MSLLIHRLDRSETLIMTVVSGNHEPGEALQHSLEIKEETIHRNGAAHAEVTAKHADSAFPSRGHFTVTLSIIF